MNRRQVYFAATLAVFVVVGCLTYNRINSQEPYQMAAKRELPTLSSPDFKKNQFQLAAIMQQGSAKQAMTELRRRSAANNQVAGSCHPLAHGIGQTAYQQLGTIEAALTQADEFCNSGFIHGVLEAHFSGRDSLTNELANLCQKLPVGSYRAWECFHGLGHGTMLFSENHLPQALALCQTIPGTYGQLNCADGALMENYNTEENSHPSRYRSTINFFFPCSTIQKSFQPDCYYYAASHFLAYHPQQYRSGFHWCQGAPTGFQNKCVAGVAAQATKDLITTPLTVAKLCQRLPRHQRATCTDSLVVILANHHAATSVVTPLCDQLPQPQSHICKNALQRVRPSFD